MERLLMVFLACGLAVAVTVQEGNGTAGDGLRGDWGNATARKGRDVEGLVQLTTPSKKAKRQIIKIPASVSRVTLVQPPLSLRHNRAPQQFGRYPPSFRSAAPWRPPTAKPHTHRNFDSPLPHELRKLRRTSRKPTVVEVSPEEFYRDDLEPDLEEDRLELKKLKKHRSAVKMKRKKPKQNVLGDFLAHYEGGRPAEGGGPPHPFDSAGSTIHIQQLPPPDAPTNNPFPPLPLDTPTNPFPNLPPDQNYVPALKVKTLPTKGRQVHSMFAQHYTTHNPQVTTNFGLNDHPHQNPIHPTAAASHHVLSALRAPALHVIHPPQLKDAAATHPPPPSRLISAHSDHPEDAPGQKATIRDILDQDCPAHDSKGYCDSPPRYPMQQIKNMVKKCGAVMEAMNTQPFEEPREGGAFARRAGGSNGSEPVELGLDGPSSWSRAGSDGLAACSSDVEVAEPGYAREVSSGRWFVIVQQPETTIQRVATDTCRSPGKPCGGLSELKCLKASGLSSKATRCLQRHTNQRLISWDPETPEECPRMRVFSFPSACTCHLDLI